LIPTKLRGEDPFEVFALDYYAIKAANSNFDVVTIIYIITKLSTIIVDVSYLTLNQNQRRH
jgi:hypothetical protein